MPLRFKIDGYPEAPQDLVVREVGQEVISAEQAARHDRRRRPPAAATGRWAICKAAW